MFDLVTGKARHLPNHSALPIVLSTTAQAVAAAVALILPALFVVEHAPRIPTMMAFVAPPPSPAPPPPPLLRPVLNKRVAEAKPVTTREIVAPSEAPREIEPEPAAGAAFGAEAFGSEGDPGGVEGGVPDGIAGGLVGGVPEPPPPPPPPPAPDRGPIRIGGNIQAPKLLHRVEPFYPPIAVDARLQGIVILEALVDRDGAVAEVKILRSAGLLDKEAVIAVRQWRYSPLVLNGERHRFILTVTLSFSLGSNE